MRNMIFFLLILMSCPDIGQSQTVIKMKREGGVSIIPCRVNGLNLNFIFDTGASNVSISFTEASFMLKNGYLDTPDIIGTSNYLDANGNIGEGIIINLKEIEIAGMKLSNVKATIVKNIKAPLLLGQSAINKLGKIQIDLASNTLTILDGKKIHDYSNYSQTERKQSHTSLVVKNSPISEDDYLEEIRSKVSEDDYKGVIVDCNKVIEMNPVNEDAYVFRGYAENGLGNYLDAIDDYNKAIEINSTYAKAYCFRGISKVKQKNYQGGLADFNKSVVIDPKSDYTYKARGDLKVQMANLQGAIADYSKAIQLDIKETEYYLNRGYAKGKLKDYLGALSDYNKAIQLGSQDYTAYLNRGNMKVELKKFRDALNDYDKSIEIYPESATSYYVRGLAKEKVKDYQGAIIDYNKTLEIDSNFIMADIRRVFASQNIKENDWINVLSQKDQQWFIRSKYESKNGSVIKVWAKELKNKGKLFVLAEFDCVGKKSKFVSTINYDSKGAILKRSNEATDWEDIIPETIQEVLFAKVCKHFN